MALKTIISTTQTLSEQVSQLSFDLPVTHIYNPLEYAWKAHLTYLKKYAKGKKKVVFLGMNPGPWGMAQTGVPFGEISLVRDWLGIHAKVNKPNIEHPKREILGFNCTRSEVSGQRLWSFLKNEYKTAEVFFKDHYITNYCPLVFMEDSGRNRTPDKLKLEERKILYSYCDTFLTELIKELSPKYLIGVGGFAEKRLKTLFSENDYNIHTILHPSPASPLANKGWDKTVKKQLIEIGIL